jgi:hypothetical protein
MMTARAQTKIVQLDRALVRKRTLFEPWAHWMVGSFELQARGSVPCPQPDYN